MTTDEVTRLILSALPDAEVRVATDDGTHYEAVVVAAAFEGKRPLQRHQLVYAGLGQHMGGVDQGFLGGLADARFGFADKGVQHEPGRQTDDQEIADEQADGNIHRRPA